MEQNADPLMQGSPQLLNKWGFWALLFGAAALILVFAQMALPMFEAKPSAGSQIGEIAGDIKRSAWRTFLGLPKPEPEVVNPPVWAYFAMVAPVLGIIAVFLSVISAILRENRRFAIYATSFGVAAIMFQMFWWLALLIAGIALLVSIIENIGDIFSF
ncbi:hypothetical protein [Sulfitobacter sp. JB4-11]|uniref:hypothetical protein n=1 Tax=Sulfitobacter rhodophyticola TaxID=3238304 RepID=UPI003D81C240